MRQPFFGDILELLPITDFSFSKEQPENYFMLHFTCLHLIFSKHVRDRSFSFESFPALPKLNYKERIAGRLLIDHHKFGLKSLLSRPQFRVAKNMRLPDCKLIHMNANESLYLMITIFISRLPCRLLWLERETTPFWKHPSMAKSKKRTISAYLLTERFIMRGQTSKHTHYFL